MENNREDRIRFIKLIIKLWLLVVGFAWVVTCNATQMTLCPEMSSTQLLLRLPKSLICDFKHCNPTEYELD